MSKQPTAIIAGAGIGGLTAAAALAQRGWSVQVHERDPQVRAIGAGIYMWSNGLRVLKAIGAYDEAVVDAHVGPMLETRDRHGKTLERIGVNRPGAPDVITIFRETLIASLRHAAERHGVEIVTGSTAMYAESTGVLHFAKGDAVKADLVVGADGVNSSIRDSLGLLDTRQRLRDGAIRMLIPNVPGIVPDEDRAAYVEFLSGSRRILYTPCSDDFVYIALCCAVDDQEGMRMPLDTASWKASFPGLSTLIDMCQNPGRWDRFERITLATWSQGDVAVIGDAAHAQPPYIGQGGGCAMMNALGLAVHVARQPDNVEAALRSWEKELRPIITHSQKVSTLLGQLNVIPDLPRALGLRAIGHSRWLGEQRLRVSQHVPLGTT